MKRMIPLLLVVFTALVRLAHAGSYYDDTMAIRCILDSNGLSYEPDPLILYGPWSVVVRDDRVVELDLSYFQTCYMPGEHPNCWGRLTVLPASEIAKLDKLEVLRLENNSLQYLPDTVCTMRSLRSLEVSRNGLMALPHSLGALDSLRELYAWDNLLETLPESLGQLQFLVSLGLGRNRLTELPQSMTQLRRLQELFLEGNQIGALPDSIGKLHGLMTLRVTNCGLVGLPGSLVDATALRVLEASQNTLDTLPDVFARMAGLVTLGLEQNDLTSLPRSLVGLPSLRLLALAQNRICSPSDTLLQWVAGLPDSAGINHQRCESRVAHVPSGLGRAPLASVTYHAGELVVTVSGPDWAGYVCDQGGRQAAKLSGDGAGRLRCELAGSAGRVVWVVLRRGGQRLVRQVCVPGGG